MKECGFHLRWEPLLGDPTVSCATVLAVGWKPYSHTRPLPCCHRSVSQPPNGVKSSHLLKKGDKGLNYIALAWKYRVSEKTKTQKSDIMRALKRKLTGIYSFVAIKHSSNLNREQLWHVGKNTGLGTRKAPHCHSSAVFLRIWLDKPWNLSSPRRALVRT